MLGGTSYLVLSVDLPRGDSSVNMSIWRRLTGKTPAENLQPQRLDYLNEGLALERQGDYERK